MKWMLTMLLLLGQRPPDPAALYGEGLAALRAQNWQLATDKLYARQQLAPDAMTFYLLAVAYSHQNQYGHTENAARRALQASPALADAYRVPAARLLGWAQGMSQGSSVAVQYTMGHKSVRTSKDLERTIPRTFPEDSLVEEERKQTVQYQAANDPCAGQSGLTLNGCRVAHANDPVRMPATRLP